MVITAHPTPFMVITNFWILEPKSQLLQVIAGPWRSADSTMLPFSLGYFKGRTRVAVLMSMLSLARDLKMDNYHEARVHSALDSWIWIWLYYPFSFG